MELNRIRLTTNQLSGGKIVKYINYQDIASELGMNYSEDTGLLYKGDNPNIGIAIDLPGKATESMIRLSLVSNGIEYPNVTGNGLSYEAVNVSQTEHIYLFYKKTDDILMIGMGTSDKISTIVSKAISTIDGSDRYCYLRNNVTGMTSSPYPYWYALVTEDGMFESSVDTVASTADKRIMRTDGNVVSLAQLIFQSYIVNKVYVACTFPETRYMKKFELNNKKYISCATGGDKHLRMVGEVG